MHCLKLAEPSIRSPELEELAKDNKREGKSRRVEDKIMIDSESDVLAVAA